MSIIVPCPWCGGKSISWEVPPFLSRGVAFCEDCDARGPTFHVANRADRATIDVEAIRAWNGARS